MYDVIIISPRGGRTFFTAEKFSVTTSGFVCVFNSDLGDISFLLGDGERLIIKPSGFDLQDNSGRFY